MSCISCMHHFVHHICIISLFFVIPYRTIFYILLALCQARFFFSLIGGMQVESISREQGVSCAGVSRARTHINKSGTFNAPNTPERMQCLYFLHYMRGYYKKG